MVPDPSEVERIMSTSKRGVLVEALDWFNRQVDSVIDRIAGPCLPNLDSPIGGDDTDTVEHLFVDDDGIRPAVVTVGG